MLGTPAVSSVGVSSGASQMLVAKRVERRGAMATDAEGTEVVVFVLWCRRLDLVLIPTISSKVWGGSEVTLSGELDLSASQVERLEENGNGT